jgi:hypothetical protein
MNIPGRISLSAANIGKDDGDINKETIEEIIRGVIDRLHTE